LAAAAEDPKAQEEKKTQMEKGVKTEKEFMKNLFLMMREKGVLNNEAKHVSRIYRDCREKAKNGIIWAKGDDDAERVIFRFFRPERVVRRLQLLYEHKCKTEGKYRHLTLFGFYIGFKKEQRVLYLVEWPRVHSKKLVTAKLNENVEEQLKSLEHLYKPEEINLISMEELLVNFEIYVKIQQKLKIDGEEKTRTEKMLKHKEKLLVSVFGKDKKLSLEQSLAAKKTE